VTSTEVVVVEAEEEVVEEPLIICNLIKARHH
jgi:hypothetical protein